MFTNVTVMAWRNQDYDRPERFALPNDPDWFKFYVDLKFRLHTGAIDGKACARELQTSPRMANQLQKLHSFFKALAQKTSLDDYFVNNRDEWPLDNQPVVTYNRLTHRIKQTS